MSDYQKLKKLDEESLKKLKEGTGPVDECICHLFDVPEKKGIGASMKRLFGAGGKKNKADTYAAGGNNKSIFVPFATGKGGKGIYSTKEVIKNKSACTKCKCNGENLVLKHSYAAIKIVTPDVSSICPCPSDCLPEKTRNMFNNVKVTVERVMIDPDTVDSEVDLNMSSSTVDKRPAPIEPRMERRSISELIEEQYYYDEYQYSLMQRD